MLSTIIETEIIDKLTECAIAIFLQIMKNIFATFFIINIKEIKFLATKMAKFTWNSIIYNWLQLFILKIHDICKSAYIHTLSTYLCMHNKNIKKKYQIHKTYFNNRKKKD